ncbi:MAG: matrixin family metalloprotease [Vicinamibacterales bacterium]
MRRGIALLVAIVCVAMSGEPASAYLKLGSRVGTRTVTLAWDRFPIRYFVTNRAGGGVTAQQLETAVTRAFGSWDVVPTAEVSHQFAGFTANSPSLNDGITTIGFVDRPDQDRVLGATNFLIDTVDGEIIESDIYLNSIFAWSVSAAGETNRFDVESIALHEIGHLHGLGHSALGETELRAGGRRVLGAETVMFPIAFSAGTIEGRTLKADDMAGLSDIYPNAEYRRERGSISGTVLKSGRGVFGAHVTAFNTRTGKLVAGFTLNESGGFVIGGLETGPHVLRVEPLDDGDIESFFDLTLNVDANFQSKFHDRIIAVPRGGGVGSVSITVVAK